MTSPSMSSNDAAAKMPILCCEKLQITVPERRRYPLDPSFVAERKLYFLCSYWSGKQAVEDPNPKGDLDEEDHLGVIRVEEMKDGEQVGIRWYAPYDWSAAENWYHKDGGGPEGGPEGKFVEISDEKCQGLVDAGTLAGSTDRACYGKCETHGDLTFNAQWYHLNRDDVITDSTDRVPQASDEARVTRTNCGKCRKATSKAQFAINKYSGRHNDPNCWDCQLWTRNVQLKRKKDLRDEETGHKTWQQRMKDWEDAQE